MTNIKTETIELDDDYKLLTWRFYYDGGGWVVQLQKKNMRVCEFNHSKQDDDFWIVEPKDEKDLSQDSVQTVFYEPDIKFYTALLKLDIPRDILNTFLKKVEEIQQKDPSCKK